MYTSASLTVLLIHSLLSSHWLQQYQQVNVCWLLLLMYCIPVILNVFLPPSQLQWLFFPIFFNSLILKNFILWLQKILTIYLFLDYDYACIFPESIVECSSDCHSYKRLSLYSDGSGWLITTFRDCQWMERHLFQEFKLVVLVRLCQSGCCSILFILDSWACHVPCHLCRLWPFSVRYATKWQVVVHSNLSITEVLCW